MEKTELAHCIYSSAEAKTFTHEEIIALLEVARANNSQLGITGILLYDNGSFFQVLEGEPSVVQSLYDKIGTDNRHRAVSKIVYEPIEERDFSEWTMGYAGITREELNRIDGLNDFFCGQQSYIDLDEGRAKTLLNAFKEGKWRSSIS